MPLEYIREGFIIGFSNHFNLNINNVPKLENWLELENKISNIKKTIKIGLIGKYVELVDAYYSVLEALKHSGWHFGVKINIIWINVRTEVNLEEKLKDIDGVVVPGGFGEKGIEDIINAINDDPYIKKFSGKSGIDRLDKIYQNKKNKNRTIQHVKIQAE